MDILFEDYYLLAVDKPAGLTVDLGNGKLPSVERDALFYLAEVLNEGSTSTRLKATPFLRAATRIERQVSGIVLLAKTKAALLHLQDQSDKGEIEKTFMAITDKVPAAETGALVHWLKKDEKTRKSLVFNRENKNLQRCEMLYAIKEKSWKGALLELHPITDFYHQARAQMAHIGCPIFGDDQYGNRLWKEHQIKLHAERFKFKHPKSGEWMEVHAPTPEHW